MQIAPTNPIAPTSGMLRRPAAANISTMAQTNQTKKTVAPMESAARDGDRDTADGSIAMGSLSGADLPSDRP